MSEKYDAVASFFLHLVLSSSAGKNENPTFCIDYSSQIYFFEILSPGLIRRKFRFYV